MPEEQNTILGAKFESSTREFEEEEEETPNPNPENGREFAVEREIRMFMNRSKSRSSEESHPQQSTQTF